MEWKNYDPSWLAALAHEQCPEHAWLPMALARCARESSSAYWHFVDPESQQWRFQESIQLCDKREGELVLDILEGGLVGGVEFLKRI